MPWIHDAFVSKRWPRASRRRPHRQKRENRGGEGAGDGGTNKGKPSGQTSPCLPLLRTPQRPPPKQVANDTEEITALLEVRESDLTKTNGMAVAGATAGATAGERQRIIGLRERYECDFPSLNSSGCLSVDACASLPAVPGASARVCPVSSFSAVSAAVAHARSTPMHHAHNSCSNTAMNSLRVVALNSRRKVRQSCRVRSRSAEVLVWMGESRASLRPAWRFLAHW